MLQEQWALHPVSKMLLTMNREIVRSVDKLNALSDSIEAKYKKAMEHIDKIEQSVLAKAFHGDLVYPLQYVNIE